MSVAHGSTTLSDRYHLSRLIARGGMADVYEGLDAVLERPVAVKVLRDPVDGDSPRLINEALALGRLNHPAIVQLFDAGEYDGRLYLVMELVGDASLRERLRADRPPATGPRSGRASPPPSITPTAPRWCIVTSSRPTS